MQLGLFISVYPSVPFPLLSFSLPSLLLCVPLLLFRLLLHLHLDLDDFLTYSI